MTSTSPPVDRDKTVLHVLPLDLPRGAQRYARSLRDTLDGPELRHRTLALFDSPFRALDADVKLAVRRSRWSKVGFEPRAALALREALTTLRPAVVVAHGSEPLKYLTPLLRPGLPLVYYKIGVVTAKVRGGVGRRFHAALLRRPQVVAGVSQECLDEAHDLFQVPRSKLLLIPNGRDPSIFYPSEAAAAGPPRLIFLGHFASSKRPEWFLEVVARLRHEQLPFSARMIGDGPLLDSLRARARELDVELLGHRDDVPALLRDADVLAFTSLPSGEGMPGVFIEAGLSGLPVVSTEVAGARTVMEDGVSGHVVGVDDLETFAARVRALLADPAHGAEMGRAARARCLGQFTLAQSTALWRDVLERLAR